MSVFYRRIKKQKNNNRTSFIYLYFFTLTLQLCETSQRVDTLASLFISINSDA